MAKQKKIKVHYEDYGDHELGFDQQKNNEDKLDYEELFENEFKSDNTINLVGFFEGYDEIEEVIGGNDERGNPIFKHVNHSKRAQANNVETDIDVTKYMNYALEYFDNRCALSGEKFIIFDESIRRENKKIVSNLSTEHIIAMVLGGNDIIPNLVPSVLQYNIQKNGYYILDWWNKARNIDGEPIYNTARHLKLVNYMLKSLEIRKSLGVKKNPEQYREMLLKPNEVDKFLERDEIKRLLISDTITATTEDIDGKKILTQIPKYEGNIPSLSKQKDIRITEEMFLQDSINLLEKEGNLPENVIEELKDMYQAVKNEVDFERELRQSIVDVLNDMGIENQYTVSNDILINSELLEKTRGISDKDILQRIVKEELESQTNDLKFILSESQMHIASSNIPAIFYDKKARDKISFWKESRGGYFEDILKRGGENATDRLIDDIIKLQQLGVKVSDITQKDTIESLAKKNGISKEKVEEFGLSYTSRIGSIKSNIAIQYRKEKKFNTRTISEKQVSELLELGISLELKVKKNTVDEFIKKIKDLKSIGVDVSKIESLETIESLTAKSNISKEKIVEIGLDPNYVIGNAKDRIASEYRKIKKGKNPNQVMITKKQVQELLELGISLEGRDITEEFINKIKLLKKMGVNVSEIKVNDTIESLAERSGVDKEKLVSEGLDLKNKIGSKKREISIYYRQFKAGKKTKGNPPTPEQVSELLELGVSLELKEKKDPVDEFIKKIKTLKNIGVDVSKIVTLQTIESLAAKSEISKEKVIEAGLDPKYVIGNAKDRIASEYRKIKKGTETNKLSIKESQVQELLELGISLELKETKNLTEEFIKDIRALKSIGIDVSKIMATDTIESLAKKCGINKEKILEIDMDLKNKIGQTKMTLAGAYRKKKNGEKTRRIPPTEEQVQELLELGISLELQEKKNTVDEFINTIRLLKNLGVDVSIMSPKDTIETLVKKSGISKEKIEEVGLNPDMKITNAKETIAKSYRNPQNAKTIPPTPEQVSELLELGISLELKEVKNVVDKFINTIKTLKNLGVDVSGITQKDTIESLAKKNGISKEKLEEVGLDYTSKIGALQTNIAVQYRKEKNGEKSDRRPIKDEQVEKLLELGISLEVQEKKNATEEFIDTIKMLKEMGIDISKIRNKDTIESLALKYGIDKAKLFERGIKPESKIGQTKNSLAGAYRKKKNGEKPSRIPPTEEQVQELLELGMNLEEIKSKNKIKKTIQENKENLDEALESGANLEGEILKAEKANEKGANEKRDGRD